MIRKGDTMRFKPEWRDAGDEGVIFFAIEDEDGRRINVEAPNEFLDVAHARKLVTAVADVIAARAAI